MNEPNLQPFELYVPITRVDDDERLVEGYCYVNADVGDGWNLKRTAMEKAASEYMQFPAVREMHDKRAAGSAEAVTFDDKGCFIRARVVDDDAWRKVKERVYRGFSVGGKPTFTRGRDIEEFNWVETSLVDRPADRSATFTLFRIEDGSDRDSRGRIGSTGIDDAMVARAELAEAVARVAALERDRAELMRRVEDLMAEAASERVERESAVERYEALLRKPVPAVRPPVRFAGVAREFLADSALDGDRVEMARLRAVLQEIVDKPGATPRERERQVARVMEIRQQLRECGALDA